MYNFKILCLSEELCFIDNFLYFHRYMSVGCSAVKLILQRFGNLIKTNIEAPPRIGVDLCQEERYA